MRPRNTVALGFLAIATIVVLIVAHWQALVEQKSAGICRPFDHGVVICVPIAPHGMPTNIDEDGSAQYRDGYLYDPNTRRLIRTG
jgi:hypothetical protein